jgi:triacylglycerol lipase
MTTSSVPVILIPGWLDNAGKMKQMLDYLRGAGFEGETVSPQPSDGSVPLETLATQALAEIDQRIGAAGVFDYVGFSMGGIIGRVILHWLVEKHRVRRFVTISSPHRGVVGTNAAWQPALRQMHRGSSFMNELNGHLTDLETIPFLSIWTPLDLTVIPSDSSVLPVGKSLRIVNPAHALMVYDPRVQRAVADFLR